MEHLLTQEPMQIVLFPLLFVTKDWFCIPKKLNRSHQKIPSQARVTGPCATLWGHLPGKTCILYRSLSFSVRSPWHAAPRSDMRTNEKLLMVPATPPGLSVPLVTNWNQDIVWQKAWPGHIWVKSSGTRMPGFKSFALILSPWENESPCTSVSPPWGMMTKEKILPVPLGHWWHWEPRNVRTKSVNT